MATIEQFANKAQSTLNGAIDDNDLSLVVTSATGFPTAGNFRILIVAEGANTDEICTVTAVSGTTFTITRASEAIGGTQIASAHASGASVINVLTAGALRSMYVTETTATLIGADTAVGASPFTFDKPLGTQDGDLLIIAAMCTNSIVNVNGPNNDNSWTQLVRYDTSSNEWQGIWYKIASSEASTWTLTHSAGTDSCGALAVFRGASTLVSFDWTDAVKLTPVVMGSPGGLLIALWLDTTSSGQFTNPGYLTQATYVQQAGGNTPQILISYGSSPWAGPVFPVSAGGTAATGYTMTAVAVFE
jgi:hypothetical protein